MFSAKIITLHTIVLVFAFTAKKMHEIRFFTAVKKLHGVRFFFAFAAEKKITRSYNGKKKRLATSHHRFRPHLGTLKTAGVT